MVASVPAETARAFRGAQSPPVLPRWPVFDVHYSRVKDGTSDHAAPCTWFKPRGAARTAGAGRASPGRMGATALQPKVAPVDGDRELLHIFRELGRQEWNPRRLICGLYIDGARGLVVLTTAPLLKKEREALRRIGGDLILLDETVDPDDPNEGRQASSTPRVGDRAR